MSIEVETLEQFDARGGDLRGCFVQSIDLRDRTAELVSARVSSALFLGCRLEPRAERSLRAHGALIFPRLPSLPFDPYRSRLYRPEELYSGLERAGYAKCPDARIYHWYESASRPLDLEHTLAAALHDQAIGDALDELCGDESRAATYGVMGGHGTQRGTSEYTLAATLGARLASRGATVVTGGGPGTMEAVNLGALVGRRGPELDAAVAALAAVPSFRPSIDAWARLALDVRAAVTPGDGVSLGIPTWFYGHEPPNVFATHVAKFFNNALREETLLDRCWGGIIYLPGAAGTVQEIFQAVTPNYYFDPEKTRPVIPLVLVGAHYWTQSVPAWPLVQALGAGRAMGRSAFLVDSLEDALGVLGLH